MTATPTNELALWPMWRTAAADAAVGGALRELYDELDAAVARRGPTCWISGRCCNFDAFGHRLYVTGLEIAWVLNELTHQRGDDAMKELKVDLHGPCVFQVNKLCSVHSIRPLGCRVFFCQQGTQQWQQELYESLLTKLRALHDEHALAYRYMEWRAGLSEALTVHQVIGPDV